MTLTVTYKVQKGKNKNECEDALLYGNCFINEGSDSVDMESPTMICLGDGVGGNAGGAKASEFVMERVKELYHIGSPEELKKELININEHLLTYANEHSGQEKMATTFTGIFIQNEKMFLAHCGNTRLYVMRGAYLKQITEDHSTYRWLKSVGNDEAAEQCNKSEILSVFGGGNSCLIERLYVTEIFENGMPNKFLLTSDGVHDFVSEDEMEDIISEFSAEEAARKLIEAAVGHGSYDDCSIAIVEKKNME